MTLAQLVGRYFRLSDELSSVARLGPPHGPRFERIEADVHATRALIAKARGADEQCDDLGALGFGLFSDRSPAEPSNPGVSRD